MSDTADKKLLEALIEQVLSCPNCSACKFLAKQIKTVSKGEKELEQTNEVTA